MSLLDDIKELPLKLREIMGDIPPLGELWQTKRKIVLLCGGAGVILIILIIAAFITAGAPPAPTPRVEADLGEMFAPRAIPPEELFLPQEPDFLPGVILEREQRKTWTTEHAEPYWIDPLEEGIGVYADMMKDTVDTLMEKVP
jgi:hypothetical protein